MAANDKGLWHRNTILIIFIFCRMFIQLQGGILKKKKRRRSTTKKFPKIALFGHILKQSTHSFSGAWSFLLVPIRFTPTEEPKASKIHLKKEILP
jgi:hypothetical protein